jgi:hypothetical protein
MSGILSEQLTAIGTLGLAVLALATAIVAGLAFWKQSQEVDTLAEQNKRDIEERRRDQASRVFVHTEMTSPEKQPAQGIQRALIAHVKNSSQQPVYELTVTWPDRYARADEPDYLTVLMPEEQRDFTRNLPPNTLPRHPRPLSGILVEFRDRNQLWWRTSPDGRLEEVKPGTETPDPLLRPKTRQAGN